MIQSVSSNWGTQISFSTNNIANVLGYSEGVPDLQQVQGYIEMMQLYNRWIALASKCTIMAVVRNVPSFWSEEGLYWQDTYLHAMDVAPLKSLEESSPTMVMTPATFTANPLSKYKIAAIGNSGCIQPTYISHSWNLRKFFGVRDSADASRFGYTLGDNPYTHDNVWQNRNQAWYRYLVSNINRLGKVLENPIPLSTYWAVIDYLVLWTEPRNLAAQQAPHVPTIPP